MIPLPIYPTSGCTTGGCGSCSSGCGSSLPEDPKVDEALSFPSSPPRPRNACQHGLMVGLDVGSTTVKAVVIDSATDEILWREYLRHDTRQAETCLEFLEQIQSCFPDRAEEAKSVWMTGSGSGQIAKLIGAKFVQEVHAVSLAVERLYPEVRSVIELGGQDAKIIVYKENPETGKLRKLPSMNDKCAGGTGAVIDKIASKLGIAPSDLAKMEYDGIRIHPVAGKCGVFAETDINSLQKQGVPSDELMASLFESIVQQNLSVLARGHTLQPRTLLLGGPNCYIRGLAQCWRHHLSNLWRERKVLIPDNATLETLILVPDNAQYFAAIGAVEFGLLARGEDPVIGSFQGTEALKHYIQSGRSQQRSTSGNQGLVKSPKELEEFRVRYRESPWVPIQWKPGTTVQAFVGIDGGSTSTKGVLVDSDENLIGKSYRLSHGNPIQDTIEVFADLEKQIVDRGCKLEILGVGTTGYAKDILKDVLKADVALVETVAHTRAGLHFYPETDVIVDVGGQDIKLIILKNGQVKDFKLNTQCSAGNGYFLQSTAAAFGVEVERFSELAFSAKAMPEFGYGCAVFMQSDIVDFQRQGWEPKEILAGLAAVLPKNIWLYVSQVNNIPKLGRNFLLQGGTQRNLAAVKAQVDFIESRFLGNRIRPQIDVHKHCGESGAIGCALEAAEHYRFSKQKTLFIGLEQVQKIRYRTTRSEATRCYFCKNKCIRTFIDVQVDPLSESAPSGKRLEPSMPIEEIDSNVPLLAGERRLIIATCEKGTVEDVSSMRQIKGHLEKVAGEFPNVPELVSQRMFVPPVVKEFIPPPSLLDWLPGSRRRGNCRRDRILEKRSRMRIGLVRALNMYSTAQFFLGYFLSLGLKSQNLIFSDYTNETLFKEGSKRGSIDPCFPSKIGIAHVHNLIAQKHTTKPLDAIFFPMIDSLPTYLHGVQDSRACPTVTTTPEAVKAAFTQESDLFAENGIHYKNTFLKLNDRGTTAREMFLDWGDELQLSEKENEFAVEQGFAALERFDARIRAESRYTLDQLVVENRLGIVLLARPYHNDPGLNHEIPNELQKLGYPIFSQDHLPLDADILEELFGDEVRAGDVEHPLSIQDVWKNSYSENTNRKLWAAKFTARHPNLVALEMSSFKCGMDAPIYSAIEEIIEASGTPYFSFKDIDENKATGAIRIRVETIAHFLRQHARRVLGQPKTTMTLQQVSLQQETLKTEALKTEALKTETLQSETLQSAVETDHLSLAANLQTI